MTIRAWGLAWASVLEPKVPKATRPLPSSPERGGEKAQMLLPLAGVPIRYPVYATGTCAADRQQLPNGSILSRDWPLPAFREHPQFIVASQGNSW